jgi:hypothetical protein
MAKILIFSVKSAGKSFNFNKKLCRIGAAVLTQYYPDKNGKRLD